MIFTDSSEVATGFLFGSDLVTKLATNIFCSWKQGCNKDFSVTNRSVTRFVTEIFFLVASMIVTEIFFHCK